MEEILQPNEVQTDANKCTGCGGQMKYDIESTDLKCERCGTVRDFDESAAVQRRAMTQEIMNSHQQWNESAVFKCDNCGAKGVVDKKSLSKHCAFCGSAHIVSTQELAGIKPDSVIPFQITKENARQRFMKWLKSRFFAKSSIKKIQTDEQFNAIYNSSWAFSANTNTQYHGVLGRRVTRYRTVNGKSQSYTTTEYFRVRSSIQQNYRDFFVQSGDRITSKTFNKLQPFTLTLIKAYRQEYLAGIVAEHYSRTIDVCFEDFANFIKRDLRNKIMRRHNADVVQSLTLNTVYNDKAFNYVLLPIYLANYTYKGKLYNFYINGASGKVVGKYPKSVFKIILVALGAAVVIGGAALLIGMMM
jgi:predicted RNA-binding Zn-ribbon protein involved in translation (DUF1610 family)